MRIDATNHRGGSGSAYRHDYEQFNSIVTFNLIVMRSSLRLNHHRRDANDGDGASTRTGTDYRRDNIGDSSAGNSPRSNPDKGRNKRARHIYQNTRAPSLFEAGKRPAQALTESGENYISS
jgi:hypothetical protein